jgi:hypothetical protein
MGLVRMLLTRTVASRAVNLGGGPLHAIIRLYSVLKTRLRGNLQRAIGDHTAQEEAQTTRLRKSASREVGGQENLPDGSHP